MAIDRSESKWKGIQHCRIRRDVIDSFAWRVVGYPARALYVEMRSELREGNNGNINATIKTMGHHGWTGRATLSGALYELQAVGLITSTRRGGVKVGSKVCSLYAFTDIDTNRNEKLGIQGAKPSFAYKALDTLEKANEALVEGVAKLRLEAKSRERGTGAKKKYDGTYSEQVNAFCGSDTEQVDHFSCSEFEQVKLGAKPTKRTVLQGV
jgi:hypothetical protein